MDNSILVVPMLLFFILLVVYVLIKIFGNGKTGNGCIQKSYGVSSITKNGEEVKSISEKRIADYFQANSIRYRYEQTGDRHIQNPDFYLPDYDVYVEFWGLVDAEDAFTRARYVRHMRRKMAIYHRRKKRLVSIYPQNLDNLDWIFRKKFRTVTGLELPKASSGL